PRWPTPRLDAPALPITVAGVAFNLPPAAIRVPVQRRPGAQERVDLAFLWPSLEPPDPNAKPPAPGTMPAPSQAFARVFMTIAAAGDTLAPAERALTIFRAEPTTAVHLRPRNPHRIELSSKARLYMSAAVHYYPCSKHGYRDGNKERRTCRE